MSTAEILIKRIRADRPSYNSSYSNYDAAQKQRVDELK